MSAKKSQKSSSSSLSAPDPKADRDQSLAVFGFDWLTEKEEHNLKYFQKKNATEKLIRLFENLQDWSSRTWVELASRSKQNGYETIPLSEFRADISDQVPGGLEPDAKIFIFRFGDCRMAGIKPADDHQELKVLGFDWDFSLYNHGS